MPCNLRNLSLLRTSYSLDFCSCFTFNLLKFKQKFCFKKILHEEKLHFLVSFSFETQFEVRQNDPEQVFEGISLLKQWQSRNGHALDQTLSNVHSINFASLGASCGMTILMQEVKFLCHCSNLLFSPTQTLRACSRAKMLHFKFSILLSPSLSYCTTSNHHDLLSSYTCKYKCVLYTIYSILITQVCSF